MVAKDARAPQALPQRPDFDFIVREISELTGLSEEVVRQRVWDEALCVGSNVSAAASDFGLVPHVYNERMEQFYIRTDAFIFETMVESCRAGKRAILNDICDRLRLLSNGASIPPSVLMLGDGSGGDTLALCKEFGEVLSVYYFDVPGSRTYEFALKRFSKYAAPCKILTEYGQIPGAHFDAVISLEVLEHLPNPNAAIRDMWGFLKSGGVALVTESFNGVQPRFPTHLYATQRFAGETAHMFARAGMCRCWQHGKLMEFRKYEDLISLLPALWDANWKLAVKNAVPIIARSRLPHRRQ
jgi:SAM-dependent methyltransferase